MLHDKVSKTKKGQKSLFRWSLRKDYFIKNEDWYAHSALREDFINPQTFEYISWLQYYKVKSRLCMQGLEDIYLIFLKYISQLFFMEGKLRLRSLIVKATRCWGQGLKSDFQLEGMIYFWNFLCNNDFQIELKQLLFTNLNKPFSNIPHALLFLLKSQQLKVSNRASPAQWAN